jgi:hypothetical protein
LHKGAEKMKWTNKGHEFDHIWMNHKELAHKKIFLFGAGNYGKKLGAVLKKFDLLEGYIDNDVHLQGSELLEKTILSLDEYICKHDENVKIVISVSKQYLPDIEKQLESYHLKYRQDYWLYDEFVQVVFPVLLTYCYGKTYMNLAQIVLTERCSLKCKKCAHACYNVDNKATDTPISDAFKSADCFFTYIDYIDEFVLIGGEPLLYKQLAEVVGYVGQNYRGQMGIYSITTNGTIVPSKEVLEECKKYGVLFRISNYSKTLPRLKDSYKRLMDKLDEYGIDYILSDPDAEWIDYGFDYLDKPYDPASLTQMFDNCHTPCREIRGSKLYYCVMARSISDNMKFNEGREDYLDLESLTGENYKKELLEFNMGYSEKGFLDMCRRCHGMRSTNYIPAAEQV